MKYFLLTGFALLLVFTVGVQADEAAPTADADLVPLPIELPQPSFGGTPLDYWSDHLEPPSFRKRKPFMAPKSARNAALGAEVTASEAPLMGALTAIVDEEKGYEDAHLVELPEGPQWIQIDLGATHTIHAIVVWHYHAADRVYFDVVARASNDETFEGDVTTLYNNDHDNSARLDVGNDREYVENFQGRLIPVEDVAARYIRLYSQGNTSDDRNHYIEVEVWASPSEEE